MVKVISRRSGLLQNALVMADLRGKQASSRQLTAFALSVKLDPGP